ncbi:MAG: WbqC family protein [Flavobacteriaceae bacterium]|nr:WbqC family protein [Flavobacteriaceae bacterium]
MPKSEIPLICLGYLPPISIFAIIAQSNAFVLETAENYQKQSLRNRTYIYGANGSLALSIPVKHHKQQQHQKYQRVRIENTENWQHEHWKSICSAYRSTPYFEFYENHFEALYLTPNTELFAFNLALFQRLLKLFQLPEEYVTTERYSKEVEAPLQDVRHEIEVKIMNRHQFPEYPQRFADRYGFLSNLSAIDALFNLGPAATDYLLQLRLQ